jgi:pyruvate kinase
MDNTHTVPNVSVEKFKRTKIIATLGPSSNSYDIVLELVKAGVNGFRLNFSHGDHDEHAQRIKWVRKASAEYGKPVAIIQDLQGPKIRLGDFEGIINVHAGQSLVFEYDADYERSGHIPTQYDLSDKVKRGETMYLYDGKVKTTVTSVTGKQVHVRVENDGMLIKRKGMNLPDTDFGGDIITDKDKADLAFGSTQDIDYVAQSFVQTATDVRALRKLMKGLGMQAKIIAKFETKSAITHMDEIVEETDAIMIARGDLAVEVAAESVPIIQRKLIGLGMRHAKPTIVATQMLLTMTETPEPTRAEVSDVATAVIVGADCVMLSDETASGQYPIEAVHVMKRIILYTQENAPLSVIFPSVADAPSKQTAICAAVIDLAAATHAKAIVSETKSGATAVNIAAMRPERPVIAVTSDKRVAQQLVLVYGLKAYVRPDDKFQATKLTNWLQQNRVLKSGDMVVTASGKHPGVVGATDTIKVRMLE